MLPAPARRRDVRRGAGAVMFTVAFTVATFAAPVQGASAPPGPSPATTASTYPAPGPSVPSPTPPVAEPGGGRVTFGVQPAAGGQPDARPYFYYVVTPGSRLEDFVAVRNYSLSPLSLDVYATDALNTATGGFGLLTGAQKPVDVGAWTELGQHPHQTVTVAPRSAAIIPVSLHVPEDATPGDHVGGIVAALGTVGQNQQGANVKLDQRVGARLFVRVSGPLHPALRITGLHATLHPAENPLGRGSVTLDYMVRNSGNVKLAGHQRITAVGLPGSHAAAQVADLPLLLPGNAVRMHATVRGVLPAPVLTAKVVLTPLQLTGDADPALGPVSAEARIWAIPAGLLALIAVVLAIGALLWWLIRSRARRARSPQADPPDQLASTPEEVTL